MALLTAILGPRGDDAKLGTRAARVADLRAGHPGESTFVAQAGEVEVRLGPDEAGLHVRRGGPGDFVGELSLLTGAPRTADVVVVEDAVLWELSRKGFRLPDGALELASPRARPGAGRAGRDDDAGGGGRRAA